MDYWKELSEAVEEAELVLVGLGEGMQFDWPSLEKEEKYCYLADQMGNDTRYDLLAAYVHRYLIEKNGGKDIELYNFLAGKLEAKNYFVVSLGIDDLIYQSAFKRDKIVTPCGGFRKLQCPEGCTAQLWEPDEKMMILAADAYQSGILPAEVESKVCPNCGRELVFNQMGCGIYCEEGYLEQWNVYMKWLQGTMNRKVCMLELGVGMQFPSVIRWPFEKLAMYNQKAKLFRIHPVLFQVGEEIKDRAFGIQADAKEFVSNWKGNDGR